MKVPDGSPSSRDNTAFVLVIRTLAMASAAHRMKETP